MQSDVVRIINQDNTTVATYKYDALGKIVDQTNTTVYSSVNNKIILKTHIRKMNSA